MKDDLFEKIVAGEMSCYKIFEDENTFAFLDINPTTLGHTLVIPKKNYVDIFEIPDEIMKDIGSSLKKVSHLLKDKLDADGVNILHASGIAAQQSVFHLHFHILPRFTNDSINLWPEGRDRTSLEFVHKKLVSD